MKLGYITGQVNILKLFKRLFFYKKKKKKCDVEYLRADK